MSNVCLTFIRPVLVELDNVGMIDQSQDFKDAPQFILLSLELLGLRESGLIPHDLHPLLSVHSKVSTVNP